MAMNASPSHENDAPDIGHLPVLPGQVLSYLGPKAHRVVLDCTVGRGGHGAMLIPKLGLTSGQTSGVTTGGASGGGRYVGLDVDPQNVAFSQERLGPIAERAGVRLDVVHANFREAAAVLKALGIAGVDGLLADLGFASSQMDDPQRGFAFSEDGPLDMRLDGSAELTAERLVNSLPEQDLADLIYAFGEERLSRRIARKIVEQRRNKPITTTSELADLVRRAYPRPRSPIARAPKRPGRKPWVARRNPRRGHRIDPATRTFMALRIAVNDELGALDDLLGNLPGLLNPGGRAAIISFHSLEDRRVKRAFLALKQEADYEIVTRKPVTADEDECQRNPRSRSAKLRVIQKPGRHEDDCR